MEVVDVEAIGLEQHRPRPAELVSLRVASRQRMRRPAADGGHVFADRRFDRGEETFDRRIVELREIRRGLHAAANGLLRRMKRQPMQAPQRSGEIDKPTCRRSTSPRAQRRRTHERRRRSRRANGGQGHRLLVPPWRASPRRPDCPARVRSRVGHGATLRRPGPGRAAARLAGSSPRRCPARALRRARRAAHRSLRRRSPAPPARMRATASRRSDFAAAPSRASCADRLPLRLALRMRARARIKGVSGAPARNAASSGPTAARASPLRIQMSRENSVAASTYSGRRSRTLRNAFSAASNSCSARSARA